jgi:hypothetical protein
MFQDQFMPLTKTMNPSLKSQKIDYSLTDKKTDATSGIIDSNAGASY